MTTEELLRQALVGKKLKHRNQWGREVVLEVESVSSESSTRELGPSTPENDWWPESETTYWTEVTFVDGSRVKFSVNENWNIVE